MTQNHTPTPYICATGPSMHGWPIVNSQGQMIAQLPVLPEGFPNKENIDKRIAATGKFIEHACNAHDDLVTALEKTKTEIERMPKGIGRGALAPLYQEVCAAIAKANAVQ